jgi:putative FmdB family regulatory protein
MATYEYSCTICGIKVEIERKITEEEFPPKCDCGLMMSRVWNATPAVFKATGFYSVENPRG